MSALGATPVAGARADDPRPRRLLRRAVIVAGAAGAVWFIGALLSAASADATPPAHPTPASASQPDAVTQLLGNTLRTVLGGKQPPAATAVAAQHVTHAVTHKVAATHPAKSSPQSAPATGLPVVVTGLLSQTTHTVQSVADAVPVPALAEVVDPLVHTVDTVSDTVIAPTLTGLVTPLAPLLPQLQLAASDASAAVADSLVQPAIPIVAARHSHAVSNVPRPPAIFAAGRGAATTPRAGPAAQADVHASVPIPTAPSPGPNPGVPASPDGTAAAAASSTGTNLTAIPPAPGRSPRNLALVA